MPRQYDPRDYTDVRDYVIAAIEREKKRDQKQLWRKEPSKLSVQQERMRRVRFLRKHSLHHVRAGVVADRLDACEPRNRCFSGACPECCRLFQRAIVRSSKHFISTLQSPNQELVAITIVQRTAIRSPGQLHSLSISNMQRQLKYALDKLGITAAIGGIDFSYNEDYDVGYSPFWCPHFYLITATKDRGELSRELRKLFRPTVDIPKPFRVRRFQNVGYRRSYAWKMNFERRIGYTEIKKYKGGHYRKYRNTRRDDLRAIERLELFIHLNDIGLASRIIFVGAKPIVYSAELRIARIP
jgi:hypothetical protein